ncbi:8-oxo-dGTP diphosphatase MutT [Aliiglaciecola lipolytica]|uniref:8-oxo-dGTP diphosphatase n=1 Tax=Aliiglaciecola lipolytica E3 TaxID=1127673 RepID=K6XV91_9ALTE|nr:8-oxo-dGTP diphosphatase MutT [Aliiglaciecola lipolytica]GAC15596.1 mutator mutT protein [Aliiglaciecola lipolytica E3]
MKIIDVAVGVIKRDNQIFISKRADELHQGGLWEFPGGKVEQQETVEQATARELLEEIGIKVLEQSEFMLIEHDYGDKQVRLHIQLIDKFLNEPSGKEGQRTQWVAIENLHLLAFPAANKAIIEKLESVF